MRIIVAGLGPSIYQLAEIPPEDRPMWIGVNDVERPKYRVGAPDHLLLMDPPSALRNHPDGAQRVATINQTKAGKVWIFDNPNHGEDDRWDVVKRRAEWEHYRCHFEMGHREPLVGTHYFKETDPPQLILHQFAMSPFAAVSLAFHLGASRIGLIGVDLTEDHGTSNMLVKIDVALRRLSGAMRASRGVELVNLSRQSRLSSLQVEDIQSWRMIRSESL